MNIAHALLSNFFFSRNVSQIVFEWKEANRLFLISFFIVLEISTQWIGYSVIWFNDDYFSKWVNGESFAMLWIISGQTLLMFIWIVVFTYGRCKVQSEQSFKFMQYSVAILYTVYSIFTYMTIGLVNILTGVGIVASTIIAMLLMNRRIILQAFALHVVLICILVALPANYISVPDIYKNITPLDQHYTGSVTFWHGFYLYLSLPKAILSVLISLFLIKGIESKLQDVQYQANYDKLTKVTNRRYITQYMFDILFLSSSKAELDSKHDNNCHALSVILLDIDFFKSINDIYGHLSGDMVLIELAQRLKTNVDTTLGWEVCRHGGEEFLIVLPHCTHKEAMAFTGLLKKAVCSEQYRIVDNMSISVTASFGVASFEDDEVLKIRRNYYLTGHKTQVNETVDNDNTQGSVTSSQEDKIIESLINKADNALYDAKRLGRNRIISANQYVDETSSHSSIELNAMRTESILQYTAIEKSYNDDENNNTAKNVTAKNKLHHAKHLSIKQSLSLPKEDEAVFVKEDEELFSKEDEDKAEELFSEEDEKLFLEEDQEMFSDEDSNFIE